MHRYCRKTPFAGLVNVKCNRFLLVTQYKHQSTDAYSEPRQSEFAYSA